MVCKLGKPPMLVSPGSSPSWRQRDQLCVTCQEQPLSKCNPLAILGPRPAVESRVQSWLPFLLQKGSLFLVDHGILSGVQTNVINGKPQFSAAPMTLLYQSSEAGPLLPLAIQVCKKAGGGAGDGRSRKGPTE